VAHVSVASARALGISERHDSTLAFTPELQNIGSALGIVDRIRGEIESLVAGVGHIDDGINCA
jgi:hypothetical protein